MIEVNRESNADSLSETVNSKTKFIEVNEQRFAYRSIGTGLPIILLNRFRGTLDTWDPAFLGGLASTFNVITIGYSGVGLSKGKCASDVLFDIGVYGFEEDFENKEEDNDSKLSVYDPWTREMPEDAKEDEGVNEDEHY